MNGKKLGRPPLPDGERKLRLWIYLPGKIIDAAGGLEAAQLIAAQSIIAAAKIREQEQSELPPIPETTGE